MDELNIQLNMRSKVAIVDQIRGEILRLIDEKQLKPGSQLPTVRQVAARLRVNFNTVARAYRQLDQAGWITTRQGRGSFINERPTDKRIDLRKPWQLDEADINVDQSNEDLIQTEDSRSTTEQSTAMIEPELGEDIQPVQGISAVADQPNAGDREGAASPPWTDQKAIDGITAKETPSPEENQTSPNSLQINQQAADQLYNANPEVKNQAGAYGYRLNTEVEVISALVQQIQMGADQLGHTTMEMFAILQSAIERRKPGKKRHFKHTQIKTRLSFNERNFRIIKSKAARKHTAKRKRH